MTRKTCFRILALSLCFLEAAFHSSAIAAGTVADFKSGLTAFKAKDYKTAISQFKKYMDGRKPDARSTYYLALANLHSNNRARAKQLFEYIVNHFPNSTEATHSKTALKLWGSQKKELEVTEETEDSSTTSKEPKIGRYQDKRLVHSDEEYKKEYALIPDKSLVRMSYTGGNYVLEGSVNGEKLKLQYTRDWESTMSLADLEKLKIPKPEGKADDTEEDKKTKKKLKLWKMSFRITVGKITRLVPVTVKEKHKGLPKLGRSFFEDLTSKSGTGGLIITKKKDKKSKGKRQEIDDYKNEYAKLPDKTEIKFSTGNQGHMHVKAHINGHALTCMFDTGASGYFGLNHLQAVGIKTPNRKPDTYAVGWAGKPVPVWNMEANVKIGEMERHIPIKIAKYWRMPPLVGQEFLRDYQYSIDRRGGRMSLWKKTVKTAQSDRKVHGLYDVKCKVEHDREYVTLKVNGRSISDVLIDTGASMTIISHPAAQAAGIFIPPNAPVSMAGGVGGAIPFRKVFVRASLGPVNHQSFPIMIGGYSGCAIGQDFMSGWRFTVDRDKKLLRFFH